MLHTATPDTPHARALAADADLAARLAVAGWSIVTPAWARRLIALSRATEDGLPVGRMGGTRAVDRLEELGLVAREHHPWTRRSRLVVLTTTGRTLVGRLGP